MMVAILPNGLLPFIHQRFINGMVLGSTTRQEGGNKVFLFLFTHPYDIHIQAKMNFY